MVSSVAVGVIPILTIQSAHPEGGLTSQIRIDAFALSTHRALRGGYEPNHWVACCASVEAGRSATRASLAHGQVRGHPGQKGRSVQMFWVPDGTSSVTA